MKEDVTAGGLNLKKGDGISINMYGLCNDPKEWKDPTSFCPDRFDPQSDLFLTPAGKRRNPYSFSPFLGGQRICIGKTFVEQVSKLTLPTLWSNFEFSFTENIDPKTFKMPANNLVCLREPEVEVMIKKKSQKVPFM